MAPGAPSGSGGRSLDDTVAETGPGIPDDAITPNELAPTDLDTAAVDASAKALADRGWAPGSVARDPASEGEALAETEAHPS